MLAEYPDLGRVVPERQDPSQRELVLKPYRIVYRRHAEAVEILTIFHGARQFPHRLPGAAGLRRLVTDGRGSEAGGRPRFFVHVGTARPPTCILWKRLRHNQTLVLTVTVGKRRRRRRISRSARSTTL